MGLKPVVSTEAVSSECHRKWWHWRFDYLCRMPDVHGTGCRLTPTMCRRGLRFETIVQRRRLPRGKRHRQRVRRPFRRQGRASDDHFLPDLMDGCVESLEWHNGPDYGNMCEPFEPRGDHRKQQADRASRPFPERIRLPGAGLRE